MAVQQAEGLLNKNNYVTFIQEDKRPRIYGFSIDAYRKAAGVFKESSSKKNLDAAKENLKVAKENLGVAITSLQSISIGLGYDDIRPLIRLGRKYKPTKENQQDDLRKQILTQLQQYIDQSQEKFKGVPPRLDPKRVTEFGASLQQLGYEATPYMNAIAPKNPE